MATTFTATKARSTQALPGAVAANVLAHISSDYALTQASVINDVYQMIRFPKSAVIIDVDIIVPDLDTSTGILLDVGYGTDVDYWIAASNVGQAGGRARASTKESVPLTLTAEDTLDIKVNTAATGTAATTGTLWMNAWCKPKYA